MADHLQSFTLKEYSSIWTALVVICGHCNFVEGFWESKWSDKPEESWGGLHVAGKTDFTTRVLKLDGYMPPMSRGIGNWVVKQTIHSLNEYERLWKAKESSLGKSLIFSAVPSCDCMRFTPC